MSQIREQSARNIPHDPINALQQPIASPRTAADNAPVPRTDALQFQVLLDLVGGQTAFDVLLVTENEQSGAHESLLFQQGV